MTAAYTPSVVDTIRKNAGVVAPQRIADVLGWSPSQLQRIADKHGIDLHAQIVQRNDGSSALATVGRVTLAPRRSEHFGVALRSADAKIIRAKAAARFTNPSALIAEVIEGALLRGKVDDLASASKSYRPGHTDAES